MQSLSVKFRACTTAAQLKEVADESKEAKKTHNVLASACKASVAKLRGAKAKALAAVANEKRKEEERLKKAKDDQKRRKGGAPAEVKGGRPAKRSKSGLHAILDFSPKDGRGSHVIEVVPLESIATKKMKGGAPWVVSGVVLPKLVQSGGLTDVESQTLEIFIQQFGATFDMSGLKVCEHSTAQSKSNLGA